VAFPLHPFAEQHRIVDRANELMNLANDLENQLAACSAAAVHLLSVLVAGLGGADIDCHHS